MTKRKKFSPFLGAVTGVAIIAAGGITAAQNPAKAESKERECEPWKQGYIRLGGCGGSNGFHNPLKVPAGPNTFGAYTS